MGPWMCMQTGVYGDVWRGAQGDALRDAWGGIVGCMKGYAKRLRSGVQRGAWRGVWGSAWRDL